MSSVLGVTPSKQSQFDRQLRRRHKSVNFRLRSKTSPIFSSTIKEDLIDRSYEKTFALSALIPLALICSCQKQDSTAEQQLAQRKTELDAREKALDEREKAPGGTREIGRETESSFGAPNSSGSSRASADGSARATRPHRRSLIAKNCTRAAMQERLA